MGRLLVATLLAACASSPETSGDTDPAGSPDEAALAIPTLMKARTASVVLSERWREELSVEAVHVERPNPVTILAQGSVVLVLRELRIEASEELKVEFTSNENDTVLVHGREVLLFQQTRGYQHRTENVSAVTVANGEPSYWYQ